MQLQIGDRMTDSTGEWEVVGRPYTTNGGKNAHVRIQRVGESWGAYERISDKAISKGGAWWRYGASAHWRSFTTTTPHLSIAQM